MSLTVIRRIEAFAFKANASEATVINARFIRDILLARLLRASVDGVDQRLEFDRLEKDGVHREVSVGCFRTEQNGTRRELRRAAKRSRKRAVKKNRVIRMRG